MLPRTLTPFLRAKEAGLLLVIVVLGALLAGLGGSVKRPRFEMGPDGSRRRVMHPDAEGNDVPVFDVKNKFLNAETLTQVAKDTSFIAIMAVGMTCVIIAGQIDLSVGSIYALCAVVAGLVLRRWGEGAPADGSPSVGAWLGVATCLATSMVAGLWNGVMITSLRVHAFIITLGTMAIYRGIAFIATGGQSIGGFPAAFRNPIASPVLPWTDGRVRLSVGEVSLVPLLVMVAVTVLGAGFLGRLAAGRAVYAVGGNEQAARYSGLRVGRIKILVFVLSGLCAGLAALLSLGYYGSATSGDAQGYELNVIAAAVVGGASLNGGRGSATGAVLGALIIQLISTGIVILGIDQSYSQIIIGAVVILAVLLDQWSSRLQAAHPS